MPFADLPTDDQLDQVSDTLQVLLGDNPSQRDYIVLCRVARSIVEAEEAVMTWPKPITLCLD
jgi:hypothetical protein